MEAPVNQVKRRRPFVAAFAALWLAAIAPASAVAAEPRVVIVSIDGCRPDVALRADMPYFRWMMQNGSYTFLATTTPAAITLPSHTSMLTGVTIERHGISGNDDEAAEDQKLKVPTIFDLAKKAGVSSGMASGKSKFSLYDSPIDHPWHPASKAATRKSKTTGQIISYSAGTVVADSVVANHAVEIIEKYAPRLLLVHFAYNDSIGHSRGWGSTAQVAGLAKTDEALGRVIEALKAKGVLEQTTIILSADHGGAGRVHGATVVGSAFIPWMIVGPGVRKNVDLSQYNSWPVQTYDTFATACDVLGLRTPPGLDGTNVAPAFEATDLLSSTTRPAGTAAGSTTTPATQP